jgi:hypothetical protein
MVVRVGFVVLLLDSYSRLTGPVSQLQSSESSKLQFDSDVHAFPRHYSYPITQLKTESDGRTSASGTGSATN